MNKIFTAEFFGKLLLEVLLLGIVVFLIQGYFNNKWQPLTAEETLKRENFLNAKRDAYYEAVSILNRNLANANFTIDGKLVTDTSNRNIGGAYPTDVEVNTCFSKLCIYSNDPEIPITFQKLFMSNGDSRPILEMVTFISAVRKDLGYGKAIIDTAGDRYKFIQTRKPN